jgi:hypothetical protein
MEGHNCNLVALYVIILSFLLLYKWKVEREELILAKLEIQQTQNQSQTQVQNQTQIQNQIKETNQIQVPVQNLPVNVQDETTERDYKAVYDPLYPSWRRLPRDQAYLRPPIFNYATRGYPDTFQYVGNLVRDSDEKVIPLFGRQKHPRSDNWEYYGLIPMEGGVKVKFPIKHKRDKEIYQGDDVKVDFFDNKNMFRAHIHDYDTAKVF